MDTQQIGLKLAIDAVGLPFTLTSFDDRLIIQKAVSIVQAAGVDLGYNFHWYLRGPYSSALTKDAFAIAASQETEEFNRYKFDETSNQRLNRLKDMFGIPDRSALASKLELLGSTLYLLRSQRSSGQDVADLKKVLHNYGKDFSE